MMCIPREISNERVNRLLTDTIFPVSEDVAWHLFCQTPWTETDALGLVKGTGVYDLQRTPVYRLANEGEPGAEFFEPREEWVHLTWPEKFHIPRVEMQFYKSGAVGFARMYLLDLEAAKGHNLRREWLYSYPYEQILLDEWPVFMGVDYATVTDRLNARQRRQRDYFVAVWGYLSPLGNLIVVDGIREQISQAEAEQRLFGPQLTRQLVVFRPADGAQQHRIGRLGELQRRRRQRLAGLIVGRAAHGRGFELDFKTVIPAQALKHLHRLGHHLGTDAVARQHSNFLAHRRPFS